MKKYVMMLDAHIEIEADDNDTKEDVAARFFEELQYKGELVKADYDIKEVPSDTEDKPDCKNCDVIGCVHRTSEGEQK